MNETYELKCRECGRTPSEIDEYAPYNTQSGLDPDEYVKDQEGTYNKLTGKFLCTDCYIKLGQPLGTA